MAKLEFSYHITFENLDEIVFLLKNTSGFDFSGYTKSSLKRRIQRIMGLNQMDFVDLKNAIVNTPNFHNYMIQEITVNVTEMFRDPAFYNTLSTLVLPYLKTFPTINVWSAGCSTGEEAYSLAILLSENKIYTRSFIYGTDVNTTVLDIAKKGIYPIHKFKLYSENFNKYESKESFAKYYTAKYDMATISHELKSNILFSSHNLVTDTVFNEFQLITCRNVLIYFNIDLQKAVFQLFYDSLAPFGFLCLGSKETLAHHEIKEKFRIISREHNIYQKIK